MNLNMKGDNEERRLETVILWVSIYLVSRTSLIPLCLSVFPNIFLPHLPPFFLDTTLVANEVRTLLKPWLN